MSDNFVAVMAAARPNAIDGLNNLELIKRYRFDFEGLEFLEELLRADIQPKTARHHSLSSMEKLLITLRYLATGEMQLNDGDIHHVSQSSVSKAITCVLAAMASPALVRRFISFPIDPVQLDRQAQQFFGVAQFPKVIGVIDGTHIRIQAPSEEEDVYINRKGYHSINVQVTFDAFDRINDVVARWPGSVHDSRILQNSGLWDLFEGNRIPDRYHLLGDSGYPCRRWLLTPYPNPQLGPQTAYNRAHKITRSKVERGIGQLKRRFAVLHGEIRMSPQKACRVVLACAILHNICKLRQIPLPDVEDVIDDDNDGNNPHNAPEAGLRYRDYIAQTYF